MQERKPEQRPEPCMRIRGFHSGILSISVGGFQGSMRIIDEPLTGLGVDDIPRRSGEVVQSIYANGYGSS